MADVSRFFDKDYEQKAFYEMADAPVDAIQGLSQGDAEKLQQAFNVKTVRELGREQVRAHSSGRGRPFGSR